MNSSHRKDEGFAGCLMAFLEAQDLFAAEECRPKLRPYHAPQKEAQGVIHSNARTRKHDEDNITDLPPCVARRKRVNQPVDDQSVMSPSDGSETVDSQDYESSNDQLDHQDLNNNELARAFGKEAIQWSGNPSHSPQHTCHNSGRDEEQDSTGEDVSKVDIGHPLSESSSTLPMRRKILTKRAASRCAEALKFSESEEEGLDPNRPCLCGPHNSSWLGAPYLPAGPGQCNICINSQLVHLKEILKHTVKSLTQECAFKHGRLKK
ncbi:hypothetical protein EI94DRAFT_1708082 [Lactarius quietus]|nr:hypothetical protein EI94DRAFT_1708082 [Lactarius quietus]